MRKNYLTSHALKGERKMSEMNITKQKKDTQTKYNILVSILYQFITAAVGLVLPRFVLNAYGSEINGIVQLVNQFLSYTVMLECGLGGMIAASFYKPLAYGDNDAISDIFINTKKFFSKIVVIYFLFIIAFTLSSKLLIHTSYGIEFVSSLVFILGISNYFSYYFAISEQILLRADQKIRVSQALQMIAIILNAVVCIIMIKAGFGIHFMKIASGLCFLITPVGVKLYAKKHYSLAKVITDRNRKLPQKSDGLAHHISFFIHSNTDMVIINIFRGVKDVSVYATYTMVTVAIGNFLKAIANGIAAKLGNIIAKDDSENLNNTFEIYCTVNMALSTYACIMLALFIVPFVRIYTDGITDINYIRPLFAYFLVAAEWVAFIRIPYATSITSAGHYRQTRMGAVGEVSTNLILSLALVIPFGLSGLAAGTLAAMIFRTVYTIWYLKDNIIKRSPWLFLKESMANLILGVVVTLFVLKHVNVSSESLLNLAFDAVVISVVVLPLFVLLNILLNKEIRLLLKKRKNK